MPANVDLGSSTTTASQVIRASDMSWVSDRTEQNRAGASPGTLAEDRMDRQRWQKAGLLAVVSHSHFFIHPHWAVDLHSKGGKVDDKLEV